jgi:hypothetical protein
VARRAAPRAIDIVLIPFGPYSLRVDEQPPIVDPMGDFLAVLGFIGFALAMLGLIWVLDRV